MTDFNAYGTLRLTGATPDIAGYSNDIDRANITLGHRFKMVDPGASGWKAVKGRLWLPTLIAGYNFGAVDARLYHKVGTAWVLLGTQAMGTLVVPTNAEMWNEVTFSTPFTLVTGDEYAMVFSLPNGGYCAKANIYGADVPSTSNARLVFPGPGNGIFQDGGTTAAPIFNSFNNTHYGTDITVSDVSVGGGGSPPANLTAPVLTGTAEIGQTMTCSTGVWTGTPTSYTYQWKRAGANIAGATSSTYLLAGADTLINCTVTAINTSGSSSATSNTITPAPPGSAPVNTIPPAITGIAQTGQTVGCSTGTWSGSPTGYTYQWKRAGVNIAGANGVTYVLTVADQGQAITCTVTASTTSGSGSAVSNTITPVAPTPTGSVGALSVQVGNEWVPVVTATNTTTATGGGAVVAFKPEDFGAVRDGVTNDTAALRTCVQAAVDAGVANGTYYAEVQFTAGIYQLSGTVTQGGATKGNALIPIPVFPDTGKKFILVLRGSEGQHVLWHWNQTVQQNAGVVLRTDVTGFNDATFGPASVIGGPTPEQGYGAATNVWSNMLIVVKGVQIVVPNNPAISGFDFGGIGQMDVDGCSVITAATPGTRVDATRAWQFGLRTPQNNNNANSFIGRFAAEGLNYGAYLNEHTVVDQFLAIYCVAGIEFGDGNGTGHGILVHHACIEACQVGVGVVTGTFPTKIKIDRLDFENMSFALVNDPGNALLGEINTSGIGNGDTLSYGSGPGRNVNGALNCTVRDMGRQKGVQVSPTIPTSATPLRNPFFRDAFVHINGGTVSSVQIADSGGAARTVAQTTGVPVLLPANAFITLGYSVVPNSWTWTLV